MPRNPRADVPGMRMIVLRVLWIGHGVEELVVAGEAADTFGRVQRREWLCGRAATR